MHPESQKPINRDAVEKTIHLVGEKFKATCLVLMEKKMQKGVSVGRFTIFSDEKGYNIREHHYILCEGLYSLDVAFDIVQLRINRPLCGVKSYVKADREYGKLKNDIEVYKHIMETSKSGVAFMVAEDRFNETLDRMDDCKETLAKLKYEVNTAIFDK